MYKYYVYPLSRTFLLFWDWERNPPAWLPKFRAETQKLECPGSEVCEPVGSFSLGSSPCCSQFPNLLES